MGNALRGSSSDGRSGRRALGSWIEGRGWRVRYLLPLVAIPLLFATRARAQIAAPDRIDRGRFTAVFYPTERTLATSLLDGAVKVDTFPGLKRPTQRVLIALAPDRERFREWIGPGAPEWGAAIAFPESHRIVMQGRSSGSDAGDPREVFRHELAHLALHESLGELPPRWFDEGYASYAAREWTRDDALGANVALALRGAPTLDQLDAQFDGGTMTAQNAYALAYRAVVELAALDTAAGLSHLFDEWRRTGSLDRAIRTSYGITLAGFEQRWRDRTRRRYGALALVGDVTLIGLVMLVAVFPLFVARRQRQRQRLAAMVAADEAADKAAHDSVLEELLRGDDRPDSGAESQSRPSS